mgnify:FL=1
MPEKTVKDIEQQAADKALVKMFGDKSRKIAILAESPFRSIWPTDDLQNKFLPSLRQIFQILGLKKGELPLGNREVWIHQEGPPIRQYNPSVYLGEMSEGETTEEYAEKSTSHLLKRVLGVKEAKSVDPAVKKKVQQFYKLFGTELKKQPAPRDPTFVNEAEWFKRYMGGEKMLYKHPKTGEVTKVQLPREKWAEVETFPYYGEEELRQRGQEIAEEYEGETVSLGIFGHAGRKFGGVGVEKPAWREALQDVDIDTAFVGACSMTQSPKICEVISANLSKKDKEAVVVLAQNMPWGTSPGQAPEEPSVKAAFQKEADIGVFKAPPEMREQVQKGEYEFSKPLGAFANVRQHLLDRFMDRSIPQRQEETYPCAGLTGNELSDCEAGHMLYNLFQGVSGVFRQRQAPTAPTFRGGTPAGSPGRLY